jgi:TnpA family transposase
VKFYQLEENRLCDPPLAFLTPEEQELVFNNGKLNNALYKVLFYLYTAEAIKSGALNIKYSYKYLSIEDYLIPRSVWNNEKKLFLERAGLSQYKDISATLLFLKESVDGSFKKTNVNIQSLSNDYIKFSKDGDPVVNTPAIEKPDVDKLSSLFTSAHYTSLLKIVAEINKTTNFLSCFEHFTIKDVKARPPLEMFFAGIIGLGCNIGIEKISNISKGINSHTLENTVNWYFTMENLNTANDVIVKYINELPLSGLFRKNLEDLHTSSDGQKYGISVDSLNANYSYKYFGSGRGVTVNSFIDERYALFHANVISSSEREAAHVIDGLLHNDIIKSTIHSTDTHGYTEIVFGLTYLLGITFAPRIQNFKDQFLYSFNLISYYKEMDYQILPNKTINEGLIESQWEDVLRFTASIKLRNVTASQVLKRLSSYSRQHPLYKALKEFGKIHKTIFLLRYMDDLGLRQRIEKQLNKIELSHKFAKAVFFGGNQEYNQETKEGQEIVTGCRRLIQNCIILWNYFYLSELISNSDTIEKKKEILKIFVEGSILTWQHVNLLGEYNFQELETNILPFNLKKIMEMDFGIET